MLHHPWVQQCLPPELASLNAVMPPPLRFAQSDEEIRAVVAAAQRNPA